MTWLKEQKIPGIYGIDTRALTQALRENGSMLGMIVPEGVPKKVFRLMIQIRKIRLQL
jgi:carbamoylphosphate synthase small subunit